MADAPTTTLSATPAAPTIELKDPRRDRPVVQTLRPETDIASADKRYGAFFDKMKNDVFTADPLTSVQKTPDAMQKVAKENLEFSGDVQNISRRFIRHDMTTGDILEAAEKTVAAQKLWQREPVAQSAVAQSTEPKSAGLVFGGAIPMEDFMAIPKKPGPSDPDRIALAEAFKASIAAAGQAQVDPVSLSPAAPKPDAGMVMYDSGKVFDQRIIPLAVSDAAPRIITSDAVMASLAMRSAPLVAFDSSKPAPKSVGLLATLGVALSRLDMLGSMQVGAIDAKFTEIPDAVENNSRITQRSSATQISTAGAAALELKPAQPQLEYTPAMEVPEYKRKQPQPVYMQPQGSTH